MYLLYISGDQEDVDFDAILGELCDLETQLSTQQTELNDSLKNANTTPNGSAVAHVDQPKAQQSAALDTNMDSQLQSALSELSGFMEPSQEGQDINPASSHHIHHSVHYSGAASISSSQNKMESTKPLDKNANVGGACHTVNGNRTSGSHDRGSGSHDRARSHDRGSGSHDHMGVPNDMSYGHQRSASHGSPHDRIPLPHGHGHQRTGSHGDRGMLKCNMSHPHEHGIECDHEFDDEWKDVVDTDSAFSDTISLPSSGSHISVTTTSSHSSGSSTGSSGIGHSPTTVSTQTCICLTVMYIHPSCHTNVYPSIHPIPIYVHPTFDTNVHTHPTSDTYLFVSHF